MKIARVLSLDTEVASSGVNISTSSPQVEHQTSAAWCRRLTVITRSTSIVISVRWLLCIQLVLYPACQTVSGIPLREFRVYHAQDARVTIKLLHHRRPGFHCHVTPPHLQLPRLERLHLKCDPPGLAFRQTMEPAPAKNLLETFGISLMLP